MNWLAAKKNTRVTHVSVAIRKKKCDVENIYATSGTAQ
jgi:hypothetical protein